MKERQHLPCKQPLGPSGKTLQASLALNRLERKAKHCKQVQASLALNPWERKAKHCKQVQASLALNPWERKASLALQATLENEWKSTGKTLQASLALNRLERKAKHCKQVQASLALNPWERKAKHCKQVQASLALNPWERKASLALQATLENEWKSTASKSCPCLQRLPLWGAKKDPLCRAKTAPKRLSQELQDSLSL